MATDETKRLILARRARFVAAALTGVAIACGATEKDGPAASSESVPDASDDVPTSVQTCLSAPLRDSGKEDGGPTDANADVDADLDANADADGD
jgi:hypothetical protein